MFAGKYYFFYHKSVVAKTQNHDVLLIKMVCKTHTICKIKDENCTSNTYLLVLHFCTLHTTRIIILLLLFIQKSIVCNMLKKTMKWTKSNGRGSTSIPIFPSKPKIWNVLIKHVPQQLLVSLLLPWFSSLKCSFCILDFLLKILQPQNTKGIHAKNYYKDYYLLTYLLLP